LAHVANRNASLFFRKKTQRQSQKAIKEATEAPEKGNKKQAKVQKKYANSNAKPQEANKTCNVAPVTFPLF